ETKATKDSRTPKPVSVPAHPFSESTSCRCHWFHRHRIAQRHINELTLDRMVGVPQQNLLFLTYDGNDELIGRQIFLRHPQDIVLCYGVQSRTVFFPVLRIFCISARKLILGE